MENIVFDGRPADKPTNPIPGQPARSKRVMVPITATETIRKRLDMTQREFGIAIGYSEHGYSEFVRSGEITKTAAMAAEALNRRQAPSGLAADEVFIVRFTKGVPSITRINDIRTMKFDGVEYFCLPSRS